MTVTPSLNNTSFPFLFIAEAVNATTTESPKSGRVKETLRVLLASWNDRTLAGVTVRCSWLMLEIHKAYNDCGVPLGPDNQALD